MTLWIKIIGYLVLISAGLGFVISPFLSTEETGGLPALVSIFILQALVGGFLIYGAKLKAAGNDLAPKVYPSSIMALVLFLAYVLHWYQHSA